MHHKMVRVAAIRESFNSYESSLTYHPVSHNVQSRGIKIKESTYMVDGIGGGVWEGAIVLGRVMEAAVTAEHNVIELGCGAGLTGIISSLSGARVLLTDRVTDLADENIILFKQQLDSSTNVNSDNSQKIDISSSELSWEDDGNLTDRFLHGRSIDIIVGAEITCLRKQHPHLVKTIDQFAGPKTIVLLSFDDLPMPSTKSSISSSGCSSIGEESMVKRTVSKYESEMDERMRDCGFNRAVICTANVEWHKHISDGILRQLDVDQQKSVLDNLCGDDGANDVVVADVVKENLTSKSYAVVHDITTFHHNDIDIIDFPLCLNNTKLADDSICDENIDGKAISKCISSSSPIATHTHHITAYYRPSATNICSRCHKHFFSILNKTDPLSSKKSCRHHSGYYVCRFHPAELNLSINGGGDSLGYYGNGIEGWEAKFWDCCGNEDENALGCTWSSHLPYT